MCKPPTKPRQPTYDAYEGEMIRLDDHAPTILQRRHVRMRHFPWWTLWLIWPLVGAIK